MPFAVLCIVGLLPSCGSTGDADTALVRATSRTTISSAGASRTEARPSYRPALDGDPSSWPDGLRARQRGLEERLRADVNATELRTVHERLSSRPHVAGTEGDRQVIASLTAIMKGYGLEVEVDTFHAYLPRPVRGEVWLQTSLSGLSDLDGRVALPVTERQLGEDIYTVHPDLDIGWNAYSASGDVTGELVYVNHGTREDFAHLAKQGVSLEGKIAIARYGGNFRGFKARFAEEAGAAGLIIYTDPEDAGYHQGLMYPEGGYANDTSIQRGSIKTLPYPGDPLTPGRPATENAERLDPGEVGLPGIPVQPIGWGAASKLLESMQGEPAPAAWQGGLPFTYRITTGDSPVRARVVVEQKSQIVETANVLGTIRGARYPDQKIIIGCHHDAWSFGAGDPQSGTIVVLEAARTLAAAVKAGWRPDRSIVFAHWGAEEYGIIGSTEYCEGNAESLGRNCVAYINLDMAAMGTKFRASSSPLLQGLIESATRAVTQPGASEPTTVYEEWTADRDRPSFGVLGGGSDHVGFYCHLGIPSCGLGAGGSPGVSYHTNYETLTWYHKIVGEDYAGAIMLTQVVNTMAARLASAPVIPYSWSRVPALFSQQLETLDRATNPRNRTRPWSSMSFAGSARALEELADSLRSGVRSGRVEGRTLEIINEELLAVSRSWVDRGGLPGRPWYRNLYAASDPHSGYAAWVFPGLRAALEEQDREATLMQWERLAGRYDSFVKRLGTLALLHWHQGLETGDETSGN